MILNTQTDSRWANDSMGIEDDKLGRWGCVNACIANILEITPKELNQKLKDNKGYARLQNPTCDINMASFTVWSVVKGLYNLNVSLDLPITTYFEDEKTNWMARIIHPATGKGHYINILNKKDNLWLCFDVETRKVRYYHDNEITAIYKVWRG